MAVVVILEFPGGTQEHYDALGRELTRSGPPPGALVHLAGPMEDGWRVIEAWESPEQAERFYREELQPIFERLGIPFVEPKVFPVHNIMKAP